METTNNKKTCRTCAYVNLNNKEPRAICGSYIGPKAGKIVILDETTCIKHETFIESRAGAIVHTSIDCAKYGIEKASVDVLNLARRLETDGANRASLIKMIDARLKKLAKHNEDKRSDQTAAA